MLAARQPWSRRNSLRRYLLALVLACLLPVIAISGIAVWKAAVAFRNTATTRLADTALTLANAVENELESRLATLEAAVVSSRARDKTPSAVAAELERIGLGGQLTFFGSEDDASSNAALPINRLMTLPLPRLIMFPLCSIGTLMPWRITAFTFFCSPGLS